MVMQHNHLLVRVQVHLDVTIAEVRVQEHVKKIVAGHAILVHVDQHVEQLKVLA